MKINDNGTNRDMTEVEESIYLVFIEEQKKSAETQAQIVADKAKAKQAVLDRLGITADEAALLLG